MAFLQDEPAAARVEDVMAEAHAARVPLLITAPNAGEVWYSMARARSDRHADRAVGMIRRLRFEIVGVDWELAHVAARFKARHGIAYADCFAAALARLRNAELVTGDPEFRQLAHQVKILWL